MQDLILYIVLILLCVVVYLLLNQKKNKDEGKNNEELERLKEALTNSNKKIAVEAIIALIKFNGLAAVVHLKKFNTTIDEWSQALILSVIKNNKVPYDSQVEILSTSNNKSLQVLASRIIQFYK